eukprot:Gb_14208 [translate_table: standard]
MEAAFSAMLSRFLATACAIFSTASEALHRRRRSCLASISIVLRCNGISSLPWLHGSVSIVTVLQGYNQSQRFLQGASPSFAMAVRITRKSLQQYFNYIHCYTWPPKP